MKKLIAIVLGLVLALAVAACTPGSDAPVNESFTENLQFGKNGKTAYCPACKKAVVWTAYKGKNNTAEKILKKGEHAHLYLAQDLVYGESALVTGVPTCLHLNGHNITPETQDGVTVGGTAIDAYSTLNVMGTGVVTGNGSMAYGSAISVGAFSPADCNIYGGTFKTVKDNTEAPVIMVGFEGGKLNMYGGTIDATENTTDMFSSGVHLLGSKDAIVEFNMSGGEIKGGNATRAGGSVYIDFAKFTMTGGIITGGTAPMGGNLYLTANGVADIQAGTITKGSTYPNDVTWDVGGGNICIYYGTVNIGKDAVISDGECRIMNHGGGGNIFNIGHLTTSGKIINGTCYGVAAGGNIWCGEGIKDTTLVINGGEIANGTLDPNPSTDQAYGCNIRAFAIKSFIINDGYIYGGKGGSEESHRMPGRNVYLGSFEYKDEMNVEINGGVIAGDVLVTEQSVKVKLTGTPTILKSITLADGTTTAEATYGGFEINEPSTMDISGLNPGAKIDVTGAPIGIAIAAASDNAETVLACFTATEADRKIEVVEKVLTVTAK